MLRVWLNHKKSVWGLGFVLLLWFLPRPREVYVWLLDHGYGDRLFHWLRTLTAPQLAEGLTTFLSLVSGHWYQIISGVFVVWLLVLLTLTWRESRSGPSGADSDRDQDADRYSVQLDHGFSLLVKWRNAPHVGERRAARDEAMGGWLRVLRDDIRAHYGESTAIRFNFPATVSDIGTNEPAEHEARLKELSRIIRDITSSALPRTTRTAVTEASKAHRDWLRPHEDVMRRHGYEETYPVVSPDGGIRKWTRREIDDLPDEEKERLFKIHPALADWWCGKPGLT
jgi:hypothetical protein